MTDERTQGASCAADAASGGGASAGERLKSIKARLAALSERRVARKAVKK